MKTIQMYAPVALQPDRLLHLLAWNSPARSLCGRKLSDYVDQAVDTQKFGEQSDHCPRCAAVLREKIATSKDIGWRI
jgi:hypothetical protein